MRTGREGGIGRVTRKGWQKEGTFEKRRGSMNELQLYSQVDLLIDTYDIYR